MNRFIKRTLGAFIVLSVIVIAALAVAVYQNNKTTTSPTKTELQSSLDNAVEWLYINQQSIMRDHNSALWWMLKEAADISGSNRLKEFYQKYKSNHLDKMPDNVWTPYFKPHYKPYVPPDITEKLHDYQIFFIYGLSCDKYLGEEPVIHKQLKSDFCRNHFFHPRCVTHQQMGVRLLQQRSCGNHDQLSTKLLDIIDTEITWDFRVTDSYLQRALMLAEGGRIRTLKPIWQKRILDAQMQDGGWSDFFPLLSLGSKQIGFTSTLPAIGPKRSDFHATAQGIWLMTLLVNQ